MEWELNLQIAEFTDSKIKHLVYEDFASIAKVCFGKEFCKIIMLLSCNNIGLSSKPQILMVKSLTSLSVKNVCCHIKK